VPQTLLGCDGKLPTDQRRPLLQGQRSALTALLSEQVFVAPAGCADQRIATLGDKPGETATTAC